MAVVDKGVQRARGRRNLLVERSREMSSGLALNARGETSEGVAVAMSRRRTDGVEGWMSGERKEPEPEPGGPGALEACQGGQPGGFSSPHFSQRTRTQGPVGCDAQEPPIPFLRKGPKAP